MSKELTLHKDWKFAGEQRKLSLEIANLLFVLVRPGLFLVAPTSKLLTSNDILPQQQIKRVKYTGDFEVKGMEISLDERLLCLWGDHQVVVLIIPSIFANNQHLEKMDVGELELSSDIENPVVKCVWHSLSRHLTHLVVISQSGTTRMYDLKINPKVPEFTHELFTESNSKGYSLVSDLDVVSAVMPGRSSGGWLPMSCFYLLRNGDIMSLSPIIPRHSIIDYQSMERLNNSANDSQRSFLDFIRKNSIKHENDYLFTSPSIESDFTSVLGPFFFSPNSSIVSDASEFLFSDFVTDLGNNQLFHIPCFAVVYTCGSVDFMLMNEGAFCPLPDEKTTDETTPNFLVIESVKVNENNNKTGLVLLQQHRQMLLLFVDSIGIFTINPSLFISHLSSCFQNKSYKPQEDEEQRFLSVECLSNNPVKHLDSMLALRNILNEDYILTISSDDVSAIRFYTFEPVRIKRNVAKAVLPKSNLLLSELPITNDFPFVHRTETQVTVDQIPLLNFRKKQFSSTEKYPDCVSKQSCEEFQDACNEFRSSIQQLTEYIMMFQHRVDLIHKQFKLTKDHVELLNKFNNDPTPEIERIKTVEKRQDLLERRIDLILQILIELSTPQLSQLELEWADELHAHVKAASDYRKQLVQVKEMLSKLEIQFTKDDKKDLGTFQLKNCLSVIENESLFLKDLRQQLLDAESTLDSIDNVINK